MTHNSSVLLWLKHNILSTKLAHQIAAVASLKICTLVGSYWAKYILFELKKYRGVIFYDTEEWCKIWRKTDVWFGKWQEYGKFSPEHLKISKLWLWWDLLSKVENVWAWNLQRSSASWQWRMVQNLERNWFVVSKLTWRIWRNLTWALERLKRLHFIGLFLTKLYNLWAKKVRRNYVW